MGKKDDSIYINRELSWLGFNERVLEEAEDEAVPLLERLKFVSIFGSNLDEFFMVRIGSLYDQSVFRPDETENKCDMTAGEQIHAVCQTLPPLLKRKDKCFKSIMKALGAAGVKKINFTKISDANEAMLRKYFMSEILPFLSPQLIDNHHPFPFLKNKELYVAVHMESKSEALKLGIVPIDAQFERIYFINTNRGTYFVLIEELIYHFASDIFTKYTFIDKWLFRVTRNADIDANEALYDQDMDWRDIMQELIKKRRRLAAVRLQVNKPLSESVVKYFCKNLKLHKQQIFTEQSPFDVSFAFVLAQKFAKTKPALLYDTLTSVYPKTIDKSVPVMEQAKRRDLLLAYPYHSIKPFIHLLEEAANDPDVTSIKITLYRVAKNSQILSALLTAVENGKDVTAVLELRARFDEQNNIDWSKQLESAGCNILYGLDDYKVHSKLLLITRRENGRPSFITQIGTGNYNEKTAEQYTDLCIITADQQIGAEAFQVFNSLMLGQTVEKTEKLLVAPNCLSNRILALIDGQIERAKQGKDAQIKIKCNSITDKGIIDKLLDASKAGVKIKLFVRGICCFRAGVAGESENITVKSIVGRYLEHSRIYLFGPDDDCEIYISSADFMTRNTHRRVEVAAPVQSEENKKTLIRMLSVIDRDNVKARIMQPDGQYVRFAGDADVHLDSQRYFFEMFEQETPVPASAPRKEGAGQRPPMRAAVSHSARKTPPAPEQKEHEAQRLQEMKKEGLLATPRAGSVQKGNRGGFWSRFWTWFDND